MTQVISTWATPPAHTAQTVEPAKTSAAAVGPALLVPQGQLLVPQGQLRMAGAQGMWCTTGLVAATATQVQRPKVGGSSAYWEAAGCLSAARERSSRPFWAVMDVYVYGTKGCCCTACIPHWEAHA